MKKVLACLLVILELFSVALAELTIPMDDDAAHGIEPWEACYLSDTEYLDDSIHVNIERFEYKGVTCTQVNITVSDPCQIRTAKASKRFDDAAVVKGALMAKKMNAVFAVNGDYYKHKVAGYIIRQEHVVRKRLVKMGANVYDVLMIDDKGDFHVQKLATTETAQALEDSLNAQGRRVINAFTFGPALILDGQSQGPFGDLWQGRDRMQRVAIAQTGELSYAVFQCDGATQFKTGLSMGDFADAILSRCDNVRVAYNLDGGGSANLIFRNEKINSNRDLRNISDIIYFASIDEDGIAKHGE